ncbi:MAG: type II toxin-antitoxin system RelE/ParE family toxin [Bacteroidia bacterium]
MKSPKTYKVVWDKEAYQQLDIICKQLEQESLTAPIIVKHAILGRTKSLKKTPMIYQMDKLKINNDGTYRALTVYSYRVSYRALSATGIVKILSVRHTSREPLEH